MDSTVVDCKKHISVEGLQIAFDLDGVEIVIAPEVSNQKGVTLDPKNSGRHTWLALQNDYGPLPVFRIYESDNQPTKLAVQVNETDSLQEAANNLWKVFSDEFQGREYILQKHFFVDGSDLLPCIQELLNSEIKAEVTWERFCAFSKEFTNKIDEDSDPNLVWLDNSGGFKARAAFVNQFKFDAVCQDQGIDMIDLTLQSLQPKELIKHSFGAWEGFEYTENSCFFFESCHGNSVLGMVEKGKVICLFSVKSCNYYRYLSSGEQL